MLIFLVQISNKVITKSRIFIYLSGFLKLINARTGNRLKEQMEFSILVVMKYGFLFQNIYDTGCGEGISLF